MRSAIVQVIDGMGSNAGWRKFLFAALIVARTAIGGQLQPQASLRDDY
jgi:hypothetical protein